MQRHAILGSIAALVAAAVLALPFAEASAATAVVTPAGTKVGLEFAKPLDTQTARSGDKVQFRVVADVIVGRQVVIQKGIAVTGTVTSVRKPTIYGVSSRVVIGFLSVNAVDRKPVTLNDVVISPNNTKKAGGAGAATAAGEVLLGPAGVLDGALVRGGYVKVPVGAVETASTKTTVTIMAWCHANPLVGAGKLLRRCNDVASLTGSSAPRRPG